MSTKANASSVGAVMTASGFAPHHTSGGCLAWQRLADDGKTQLLISDENSGLGKKLRNERYLVGMHVNGGNDWIDGKANGVDAAVTWCHQAQWALDIARRWVKRLGGSFHPGTPAADYKVLSDDECALYVNDMSLLMRAPGDPAQYRVLAMKEAGR